MKRVIAVIGLGYVGAPVAASFAARGFDTIGFDINQSRVEELRRGLDRTGEVKLDHLDLPNLTFTSQASDMAKADFYIVTVPTPVDRSRRPDLGPLLSASKAIGPLLNRGDVVVYESTVYPGATEEHCLPVLEDLSGLKCGPDFKLGYSPERISPGDKQHRFETIVKVVSGNDEDALEIVASTYDAVVEAGIHRAPNIKTAEAAKVIENTQRDLNIAFVNELSQFFDRLDIDTMDVIEAASTKWNFLPFSPGLVGGHCIGVDPYYLAFRAEEVNYHPEVLLAGRRLNDGMGQFVANQAVKMLLQRTGGGDPIVTVLGLTFKENVPDLRNSRVFDIIQELQSVGISLQVADSFADPVQTKEEYGLDLLPLDKLHPCDLLILAVPHRDYLDGGWDLIAPLLKEGASAVMDIKSSLDREQTPETVNLWRL